MGKGRPTEWTHLTKALSPKASSTLSPIRVIIRMLTTTYAESVSWTPIFDNGDPTGPMLNGITNMVRPWHTKKNPPHNVSHSMPEDKLSVQVRYSLKCVKGVRTLRIVLSQFIRLNLFPNTCHSPLTFCPAAYASQCHSHLTLLKQLPIGTVPSWYNYSK